MATASFADPSLRSLLDVGLVVGTFLKIPRFEVVDLLALAGFDFVVCDYEHAQMTIADATDIVRAGVGRGLPVVVRVPTLDRGDINCLLEAGAAGIQLARGRGMRRPAYARSSPIPHSAPARSRCRSPPPRTASASR